MNSKNEGYDHKLTLSTNLVNSYQEESPLKECDEEFRKLPYKLYKFCLVLSIIGVLASGYFRRRFLNILIEVYLAGTEERLVYGASTMMITSIMLAVGAVEMVFAINTKKPSFAQRSFLKFQYSMINSIMGLIMILENATFDEYFDDPMSKFGFGALTIISGINLAGGFAVNEVFRQKSPLTKLNQNSEGADLITRDFIEQNEAIASELLKYDLQLSRLPYLIFRFWLKLLVAFEMMRICAHLAVFKVTIQTLNRQLALQFFQFLGLSAISLVSAYSGFEMEVAIRTKILTKSRRAVLLLKICIFIAVMTYLVVPIGDWLVPGSFDEVHIPIFWFAYCIPIPMLTLIGALRTQKILEQRNELAKFSSYADDLNR